MKFKDEDKGTKALVYLIGTLLAIMGINVIYQNYKKNHPKVGAFTKPPISTGTVNAAGDKDVCAYQGYGIYKCTRPNGSVYYIDTNLKGNKIK